MALRAGPVGLLQEGGGHNVGWLGRAAACQCIAWLDFDESSAGGWQLAALVVRPLGSVGRR